MPNKNNLTNELPSVFLVVGEFRPSLRIVPVSLSKQVSNFDSQNERPSGEHAEFRIVPVTEVPKDLVIVNSE